MTTLSLESSSRNNLKLIGSSGESAVDPNRNNLVSKLVELWSQHHRSGLEVRLQTGQLLNETLGGPAVRQPYGGGVLKDCAAKIGVAVSELSRMRTFASHYASLEDVTQKHPEVTTWTEMKALLPTLTRKGKGTETKVIARKAVVAAPSRTPVRRTIKTLKNIHHRLDGVHLDKSEALWTEFNNTIRDLVAAASNTLGVSFKLVEVTAPRGDGTTNQ